MENYQIDLVVGLLEDYLQGKVPPVVNQLAERAESPFGILITTILSARTKDEVTEKAASRLLARADSPTKMLSLSLAEVEQLIFPVGFYRTKARHIHRVCAEIIERFDGQVPDHIEGLLSLPSVGRKTANLVLSLAFEKDAICVDTHVHRITNRMGFVKTSRPEETEQKLKEILPRRYWKRINTLLVKFGQDICRPISPLCSSCPIRNYCRQIGIEKHR